MKDKIKTYWCVRLAGGKFKREHVFCQFESSFRDEYLDWLEENLPKLYKMYGKDMISLRVSTASGIMRPFIQEED